MLKGHLIFQQSIFRGYSLVFREVNFFLLKQWETLLRDLWTIPDFASLPPTISTYQTFNAPEQCQRRDVGFREERSFQNFMHTIWRLQEVAAGYVHSIISQFKIQLISLSWRFSIFFRVRGKFLNAQTAHDMECSKIFQFRPQTKRDKSRTKEYSSSTFGSLIIIPGLLLCLL